MSLSLNQQPRVSSLAVACPRVSAHCVRVHACICGCGMWIRCASVLERLMKSSLKIKVPCGQHSGRAGSKSNLGVPALETQPQPKRKGQGTAKQKIPLTQRQTAMNSSYC